MLFLFLYCMSMGCIYFAAYFVFRGTSICSPVFMLTRMLCVCTCISLLSNIYFKAYIPNYKMIWAFFVPWFWAPLGFYFILFLWVPLLAYMAVGNGFVMSSYHLSSRSYKHVYSCLHVDCLKSYFRSDTNFDFMFFKKVIIGYIWN